MLPVASDREKRERVPGSESKPSGSCERHPLLFGCNSADPRCGVHCVALAPVRIRHVGLSVGVVRQASAAARSSITEGPRRDVDTGFSGPPRAGRTASRTPACSVHLWLCGFTSRVTDAHRMHPSAWNSRCTVTLVFYGNPT